MDEVLNFVAAFVKKHPSPVGSGNYLGTTFIGGASGVGVVFKSTSTGTITVIHSFSGGSDGQYPFAGLVADGSGNFWGTTSSGGAHGQGTIFELTSTGSGSYTYSTIFSFSGGSSDGANPYGPLYYETSSGHFYGTPHSGGTSGEGTVFEFTP